MTTQTRIPKAEITGSWDAYKRWRSSAALSLHIGYHFHRQVSIRHE